MQTPLLLNLYHIPSNPAAGAHDPGMLWDPVSQRYWSYCTDAYGPALGVPETIGIPVRSSPDLVHFQYHGIALSPQAIRQGQDNGPQFPQTRSFWAPFVEYANGEYRMYYSATRAFGSSESRIWLAVAQQPQGPFENRGVVADTWGTDDTLPNAIDPHILRTEEAGSGAHVWLVYGSFFGGIFLKELNPDTGLPLNGNPKDLGLCISHKADPVEKDGPEGASAVYVPETGYYYLFQSYDWLGDSYDIRVGRSTSPAGPYLDRHGRDLRGETLGEKLAGSYWFSAAPPAVSLEKPGWSWGGFRGPGHGVPFWDPIRSNWFFVHHMRDGSPSLCHHGRDGRDSYQQFYMIVRPMFFADGWPVLSPEPFAGQDLTPQIPVSGDWELICFDYKDNHQKRARRQFLSARDPLFRRAVVHQGWDLENGGTCLCLTGTDAQGQAVWGKLLSKG